MERRSPRWHPVGRTAGHRVSKREWLRLTSGLAGAALFTACGTPAGDSEPQGVAAAPVTIRHMPWNAVKDIQGPQDVAQAFNAQGRRITVEVEPPGGTLNVYQKLETLLAADQEPDTLYLQGWLWQNYALRGALLDLNTLIRKDRGFPANAVFPTPHVEQTRWQDRTYMVPNDSGGFVLFYNKDLFERAGVAFPTDRWTWDDWFKAAEKITSGQGDTKVFGYQAQESWVRNAYWIKQAGKEAWDRIVGPSRSLLDDPVVLDTLQRQVDMRTRYRYAPMPADGATIYNGRAAMLVEGDWTMWTYRQNQNVRWGVAPLPSNKKKATVLLVHGSSMTARTKAPEAAWEWMKFYTGEDAQRLHVMATGRVTITPELAKKIFLPYAKSEFGCENPEVFLTRWEYGSHWGISDVMADIERETLTPSFVAAFRGEQPAATALPEAAKKANEMLKSSRMVTNR